MIGSRLGRYEILSKLGEGGMGEVYVARDTRLGRKVALKVLSPKRVARPRMLSRLEREARTLAALRHPNIVTIYSVDEIDGRTMLSMELVEGVSLRSRIEPPGMALSEIVSLAAPLADALSSAHERGVVHRDLKPENVVLETDGTPKLLDFGIAKLTGGDSHEDTSTVLTEEGSLIGTAHYMSPEQILGRPVGPASDVFSLGVVLFELATGERPFHGATIGALHQAIVNDEAPPLGAVRPELGGDLARLIDRCLKKEPKDRWRSAAEIRDALRGLSPQTDATELAPGSGGVRRVASRRLRRWVAGAAAALLLAAGAYWLSRWRPGPRTPGAGEVASARRVVVLPFENLGPVERAYLAAGITEEVTSLLAEHDELEVIASTTAGAYLDSHKTVSEIGVELAAGWAIEGSVRWGEDRVRVLPRLIHTARDARIWEQPFEMSGLDLFALPAEIAQAVVEEIGVLLLERSRGAEYPTTVGAAYDAFLRGRYAARQELSRDEPPTVGLAELRRAVELDPGFSDAWAELALVATRSGDEVAARSAAQRALALAPRAPRVLVAVATFERELDGDPASALRRLEALPPAWQDRPHVVELRESAQAAIEAAR